MSRYIDADALKDDILKSAVMIDDRGIQTGYEIAIELIKRQPTIDAIPVSFIEEQAKLCNEIGFQRGEECYMALIEKWREKNGTKTD